MHSEINENNVVFTIWFLSASSHLPGLLLMLPLLVRESVCIAFIDPPVGAIFFHVSEITLQIA